MNAALFEVLLDCPSCRVESAVVAVMDPDDPVHARGEPVERRCRVCGAAAEAREGVLVATRGPADLSTADAAQAALARFAAEEGEDVDGLCRSAIGLPVAEVVARLMRGDPIPTNFDAVAWLFGNGSAGVEDARVGDARDAAPPPRPKAARPPSGPRLPARALASVMVADGEVRPAEIAFIASWLTKRGLPLVAPSELRVWRPSELGPPPTDAADLLRACVELAHIDQEPDDAEWRVVQSFSRAWGHSDAWLAACARDADARHATAVTRAMRRLATLVRTR